MNTSNRVAVRLWGDLALWTIPGTSSDPVSQSIPSASAVCGVLARIYGKPQFRFIVEKVFIHKIPNTIQIKVNEYKDMSHTDPQQRTMRCLVRPEYTVIARIELIDEAILPERKADCTVAKYHALFLEHARTGSCVNGMPCMGRSDFLCQFDTVKVVDALKLSNDISFSLGWAFYGIDMPNPVYFLASIENGWVEYESAKKEVSTCR